MAILNWLTNRSLTVAARIEGMTAPERSRHFGYTTLNAAPAGHFLAHRGPFLRGQHPGGQREYRLLFDRDVRAVQLRQLGEHRREALGIGCRECPAIEPLAAETVHLGVREIGANSSEKTICVISWNSFLRMGFPVEVEFEYQFRSVRFGFHQPRHLLYWLDFSWLTCSSRSYFCHPLLKTGFWTEVAFRCQFRNARFEFHRRTCPYQLALFRLA